MPSTPPSAAPRSPGTRRTLRLPLNSVSPRASRTSAPPAANGRAAAPKSRSRAPHGITAAAKPDELLAYYRQMLRIRRFEEKAAEMYQRDKIGGYCHLNL